MVFETFGRQNGGIELHRKYFLCYCWQCFKKNELKPWKVKGWVIPPHQNSEFVANMENVLDLYKRPYDERFPVVCMDESPKQLIGEGKPGIPAKPGQDLRVDYEYVRHGVVNIFMANEPLKGKRLVKVTETKTKEDWALFVKRIANEMYPKAEKIILVMDNFKTHSPSAFYEAFESSEANDCGIGSNLFSHLNTEVG